MKSDTERREQRILDAASELIMRQGYDKTTMSDIADEAGVSRGIVYLHFESKEKLFEALVFREFFQYAQAWAEYIEADPRGGTIGSLYRAVLYAINSRPLMAAMIRKDRRVVGSYLRKPDSVFASMQSTTTSAGFLQALQTAGAVREDIDPVVMAYIMDTLIYGLLSADDLKTPEDAPSFDVVIEAVADMMDRVLTPEDGGNREAGKAVIRQIAIQARAQVEQAKPASGKKEGTES